MGKKVRNAIKKTGTHLDTGARTIANGPLFIIQNISLICMKILSIFKVWVLYPIVAFFMLLEVYYSPRGGNRDELDLPDFVQYVKFLFSDYIKTGAIWKNLLLFFAVATMFYLFISFIRIKIFGSIYEWSSYHRTQNNETIRINNDVVNKLNTVGKYDSKRDYLKEQLKDFKNSDDYNER